MTPPPEFPFPPTATGGSERLSALAALAAGDLEPVRELDNVARIAAAICGAPLAVIVVDGREPAWFRARAGFEFDEKGAAQRFINHVKSRPAEISEVANLRTDVRFAGDSLVTGDPFLRFFAGTALVLDDVAVGAICVFDDESRILTPDLRAALAAHTDGILTVIKHRRAGRSLAHAEAQRARAERELFVFSSAIAHANDAILIFTKRKGERGWPTVTFANEAWGRMVGRDAMTSIGRSASSVAAIVGNDRAFAGLTDIADGALPVAGLVKVARVDGVEIECEMTVAALPRTSEERRWVAILRDLSDRRNAERAEREAHVARLERGALLASERRLRDLFERTPAITFTLDRELRFRSSLGGGLRAIGLEPDQLVGTPLRDFLPLEGLDHALDAHRRTLAGESVSFEHPMSARRYRTFLEPIYGQAGSIEGVAGISFDLTDYVASVEALARTEAHLARTERTAKVGTWLHDLRTGRRTNSDELHRIFGLTRGHEDAESFLARIAPDDRDRVRAELAEAYATATALTIEYRIESSRAIRWVRESLEFLLDTNRRVTRVDGIVVDITERRSAELEIARLADTDDVTGLPNRAALTARVLATRSRPRDARRPMTFIVIDLDRFQATNESFGHTIGDRFLHAAAERIVATAPRAFAARLDGDAFAVLVPAEVDAIAIAEALHEAFQQPFQLGRYRLFATISVGLAAHEPGETAETFLRRADMAMSAAKAAGGNRTVAFDDEIAVRHRRRVALDLDMRGALDRGEFSLVYQPIVDGDGNVVRVEALLRWQHPGEDTILPGEFVPIAELNGEILPIGRWALGRACADLRYLRTATGSNVRVAVNVSARQFADPELLMAIEDALRCAALEPSALELEITESTIASDPVRAAQLLAELRASGVTISIDDFGTGFSSFASLQRLPIDALKIDRSFVRGTPDEKDACAIVDAILGLAEQLSLEVVAEGVERGEQATFLRSRGCTLMQGYYFARPAAPSALVDAVAVRRAASKRVRGA